MKFLEKARNLKGGQMGYLKKKKIKFGQKVKRIKKRKKLEKKGLNPDDFFRGNSYIAEHKVKEQKIREVFLQDRKIMAQN